MAAAFTDDDIGKSVVNQRGVEVGTVSDVRDGEIHVRLGPDAPEDTVSDLGWDGVVNQEEHHLRRQYVSNVSENIVRLNV